MIQLNQEPDLSTEAENDRKTIEKFQKQIDNTINVACPGPTNI